jgi:hypothetical protein
MGASHASAILGAGGTWCNRDPKPSLRASVNQPAALERTPAYPPADLTAVNVTTGPVATAAAKSISCTGSAGTYYCLQAWRNENTMASGAVATVGGDGRIIHSGHVGGDSGT